MLAEGGVAVSSGPHVLTTATHIKNAICKFAKAASETVKQLELFDTLRSGHSVAPSLLEEARSWAHSADSHRALVTSVVDGIRLSSTSVLLRGLLFSLSKLLATNHSSIQTNMMCSRLPSTTSRTWPDLCAAGRNARNTFPSSSALC